MKLTYDPRYNIAYLQLQDKPAQVETVRVGEDLNIDLAPDGTVSGIEFLNAKEQLFTRVRENLFSRTRPAANSRKSHSYKICYLTE